MKIAKWGWRVAPFVVALYALAAWPAAAADGPAGNLPEKTVAQLRQLGAAADRNDCEGVLRVGEALLGQLQPHALTDEVEASVYELVANCAYSRNAKQKAHDYALRGSQLEGSSDDLWHLRLWLEIDAKNYDAAIVTVEQMSAGRGAALNTVPMTWFFRLQSELKDSNRTDQRKRLLKLLAADSYFPEESSGGAQGLHYQYALLLAEQGDADGARDALRGVTDPRLLAEALFEPRLRGVLPPKLDLRASTEAQLAIERDTAARRPDRLGPLVDIAEDLRRLGRAHEALTVLQSVSGQIDDSSAFKDRDDKLSWYWDGLARSYAALGRYEDTVAAFRKGIDAGEHSGLNVSQTINLAEAQVQFGHGDEALKTLAGFENAKDQASPYGIIEFHFAHGCAEASAGNAAAAAADLDYAKAHEKDHREALGDLYLCLGRMDDAAAAFIRRLDDPDRRAAALRQLSDYDDPPANVPQQPYEARLKALKARPDVHAAIERAGGIRRIPLQQDEL